MVSTLPGPVGAAAGDRVLADQIKACFVVLLVPESVSDLINSPGLAVSGTCVITAVMSLPPQAAGSSQPSKFRFPANVPAHADTDVGAGGGVGGAVGGGVVVGGSDGGVVAAELAGGIVFELHP